MVTLTDDTKERFDSNDTKMTLIERILIFPGSAANASYKGLMKYQVLSFYGKICQLETRQTFLIIIFFSLYFFTDLTRGITLQLSVIFINCL